jgi:TatD DNase family protein
MDVWRVSGPFVIGLHPWWIEEVATPIQTISNWIDHPLCVGVGETGLDKSIKIPLALQMLWFKRHFELAQLHEKPLIVLHIVRSWSELKGILKEVDFKGQILLHDCQAPPSEVKWLAMDSRLWFSYGSALGRQNSKGYRGFLEAPSQRVLFETDDSGEGIESVVKRGLDLRPDVNSKENTINFLKAIQFHLNANSTE